MTLQERCDAYAAAFPQWPGSWPRVVNGKIVGLWHFGQDYRNKTPFYGAYPANYRQRVESMFPDRIGRREAVLHAFSGSLAPGDYMRCDLVQPAEFQCSVYDIASATAHRFSLLFADPPYTKSDAEKYGTPMVIRRKATAALAQVSDTGAYLCWLDTVWPMHRSREWKTVGMIAIVRSTNHRVRLLTLFERVDVAAA
jgi:hypothetical protein